MTKKINKQLIVGVLVTAFMLGLAGPFNASAATTPSLGAAATFGILAETFTRNVGVTAITGDLGYTTLSGGGSHTVSGSTHVADATYNQAGIDQGTALTALASQPCTFTFAPGPIDLATDTTHGSIGIYTPGVYCTSGAGAASIGTGGITLSGAGTYIFRVAGALTSVSNSVVSLANSASSCDVFWTPTQATTLGANSTFIGTNIDASGITVGSTVNWTGRALAFGGTVTTDTDTINSTCTTAAVAAVAFQSNNNTITVIKNVINDNGGTAAFSDFPLFINGSPVSGGQSVALPPGIYTVTETNRPGYVASFTGNCDANGRINHGGVNTQNNICTIVNDDIGAPPVAPVPPLIDVVKVPSPLALPNGPGLVTYTYTVKNIGTVPMTNVTLVGDTCSPVVLMSGDTNNNSKLDLTETWIYQCAKTITLTTQNTVVATGHANGLIATDVATATVVVGVPVVPPLIHITKVPSPLTLPGGAGMVTYTKKVTNPGAVALSNVRVTDDKCATVTYISGDANFDSKLDLNEIWTYTCRVNLTKTTTNTATAVGSANGLTATDFALATVVVAVPKLPNTGFGGEGGNNPFNIAMFAGILMLASVSLVIALKKS